MSKLMQAANVFRNFMYVLMGKKLKGSQSGVSDIVSNLGGIETAGDDASSGLDDATSSAKKLKKALSAAIEGKIADGLEGFAEVEFRQRG
jgi:hypothetical protein